MKNLGIGGRNNTLPVSLRHGEIIAFQDVDLSD
jgi:hypothetical protein